MSGQPEASRTRRGLRAIGAAVALPLRIADFILGVPQLIEGTQTVRELERLAALREAGDLTGEEYRRAKDSLLGGSSNQPEHPGRAGADQLTALSLRGGGTATVE